MEYTDINLYRIIGVSVLGLIPLLSIAVRLYMFKCDRGFTFFPSRWYNKDAFLVDMGLYILLISIGFKQLFLFDWNPGGDHFHGALYGFAIISLPSLLFLKIIDILIKYLKPIPVKPIYTDSIIIIAHSYIAFSFYIPILAFVTTPIEYWSYPVLMSVLLYLATKMSQYLTNLYKNV